MKEEEVFNKVVDILRPFAKDNDALEAIKMETSILGDLKVNSARLVDVVLEIEDTFDLEVSDEDADNVRSVGDAVKLIVDAKK